MQGGITTDGTWSFALQKALSYTYCGHFIRAVYYDTGRDGIHRRSVIYWLLLLLNFLTCYQAQAQSDKGLVLSRIFRDRILITVCGCPGACIGKLVTYLGKHLPLGLITNPSLPNLKLQGTWVLGKEPRHLAARLLYTQRVCTERYPVDSRRGVSRAKHLRYYQLDSFSVVFVIFERTIFPFN